MTDSRTTSVHFLTCVIALALATPSFSQDAASPPSDVPPVASPPQTEETAPERPVLYPVDANARADVAAALARAKKENRRVLIQWGAEWCGWCHLLHQCFEKDRDVARTLSYEYDVVRVDIGRFDKNLDLVEQYGAALKTSGVPFLTILDADGQPISQQETGALELAGDENRHDPAKVNEFLTQHVTTPLDARAVMTEALSRANAENKRVFLHFGAPWCGWCHRLEDWLAQPAVAELLAQDFIDLKIDVDRMTGGKEIMDRMTGGKQSGIPYFAFLDADGTPISDSFAGPDGSNLGFPYSPDEIDAFRAVLAKAAVNLDPAKLDAVATSLNANRDRVERQKADRH